MLRLVINYPILSQHRTSLKFSFPEFIFLEPLLSYYPKLHTLPLKQVLRAIMQKPACYLFFNANLNSLLGLKISYMKLKHQNYLILTHVN